MLFFFKGFEKFLELSSLRIWLKSKRAVSGIINYNSNLDFLNLCTNFKNLLIKFQYFTAVNTTILIDADQGIFYLGIFADRCKAL